GADGTDEISFPPTATSREINTRNSEHLLRPSTKTNVISDARMHRAHCFAVERGRSGGAGAGNYGACPTSNYLAVREDKQPHAAFNPSVRPVSATKRSSAPASISGRGLRISRPRPGAA